MNRKPQPADSWWKIHQTSCNGTFIKVSEPEPTKEKSKTEEKDSSVPSFKGKGRTWSETQSSESSSKITEYFKKSATTDNNQIEKVAIPIKFTCVNCTKYETESLKELNEHLDICLNVKNVIDLT